jgi:hypothetical protein
MEKTAIHYLLLSYVLVKENFIYVLIPAVLTSGLFLADEASPESTLGLVFLIMLTLFVIVPLFYGQFIELLKYGQKDAWGSVFKKYWTKVFAVNVLLKTPALLLSLFNPNLFIFNLLFAFAIEVAAIYILPLVLLQKEIIGSIKLGVLCLVGNWKYSLPLVYLLGGAFLLPYLMAAAFKHFDLNFLIYIVATLLTILTISIEFTVFVAAGAILRDKVL